MIQKLPHKARKYWRQANSLLAGNLIVTVIIVAILASIATAAVVHNSQAPNNQTPATQPEQLTSGNSQISGLSPSSSNSNSNKSSATNNRSGGTSSSTTSSIKQYVAPACTKTPTPYKTSYFEATWLGAGSITSTGGTDGYTETCTADSNGYTPQIVPLNPLNRVIDVGDGGASLATPIHDGETYDEVYNNRALPACDNLLAATNNDPAAKQWCINNIVAAILHYYGY